MNLAETLSRHSRPSGRVPSGESGLVAGAGLALCLLLVFRQVSRNRHTRAVQGVSSSHRLDFGWNKRIHIHVSYTPSKYLQSDRLAFIHYIRNAKFPGYATWRLCLYIPYLQYMQG